MLHGAGIFTYIWVIFGANVDKYSIHGAYGLGLKNTLFQLPGLKANPRRAETEKNGRLKWTSSVSLPWFSASETNQNFQSELPKRSKNYPLVNVYVTMENHHAIHGKINYFDWAIFNSKLLVYQRVGFVHIAFFSLQKVSKRTPSSRCCHHVLPIATHIVTFFYGFRWSVGAKIKRRTFA